MEFVIFDLETTGLSAESHEIIEMGAVWWRDGQAVDTFHAVVKPTGEIPSEILELTQTTYEMYVSAEPIDVVLPRFLQFIDGKPLCGHNVAFDIAFLVKACDDLGYDLPTSVDALDTLHLARVLLPMQRGHSLSDLAQHFGIDSNQFHRALDDACTTGHVLASLSRSALNLPYMTLQQLTRLASLFSPLTAQWYGDTAEERFRVHGSALPERTDAILQLAFSSPSSPDRVGTALQEDAEAEVAVGTLDVTQRSASLLDSDSPLGQFMPGYEVRPGQKQMVEAVARALDGDEHLVVEAGTGTGKSLAYLIPAALYALKNDTRVLVSTHTIALQDQIQERDFPMLRKVINAPLSLTVFKGRTHYICMRKVCPGTSQRWIRLYARRSRNAYDALDMVGFDTGWKP